MKPDEATPAKRGISVAWVLVAVLSALLLLVAVALASGVLRFHFFNVPIL